MTRRRVATLVLGAVLATPVAAGGLADWLGAPAPVLQPQQAFGPQLQAVGDGRAQLRFSIAPGYYLYRDRLRVTGSDGQALPVTLPAGEPYQDPEFGAVTVLRGELRIDLPATVGPGASLDVRYQGCAEGRLCYAPVQLRLQVPQQ
ncbi:protein-disulfide reductase DsbD domain-containing protein [Immundisolibacter sp.]|uniref:protein-disulfide reductase DsbD domain-containing protein n=1 Tax=Immundisolibacter sp. TaxID=1934948 RepID=UPI003F85E77A